jgi:hypothetical protein
MRLFCTCSATASPRPAGTVPTRGEKGKAWMCENFASRTVSRVSRHSSSLSLGSPRSHRLSGRRRGATRANAAPNARSVRACSGGASPQRRGAPRLQREVDVWAQLFVEARHRATPRPHPPGRATTCARVRRHRARTLHAAGAHRAVAAPSRCQASSQRANRPSRSPVSTISRAPSSTQMRASRTMAARLLHRTRAAPPWG